MNSTAKAVLFETATLLGFFLFALLGLWIDLSFGLQTFLGWAHNYLGIILIGVGSTLRFWASSTIFDVGNGTPFYAQPPSVLVTRGPYRFIRNPLYLGGFLIYVGILVTIPSVFFAALGLVGLPIAFVGVAREERGLERRFGEAYRRYKETVPGWLPRIRGAPVSSQGSS